MDVPEPTKITINLYTQYDMNISFFLSISANLTKLEHMYMIKNRGNQLIRFFLNNSWKCTESGANLLTFQLFRFPIEYPEYQFTVKNLVLNSIHSLLNVCTWKTLNYSWYLSLFYCTSSPSMSMKRTMGLNIFESEFNSIQFHKIFSSRVPPKIKDFLIN